MKICIILSGSIAAFKACELVSKLVKAGHEVQTMATEGALRFVGEISLEALSGRPLMKDIWQRRESMEHIAIRRWADLFVFYPATANRINQLAAGIAEDLVGATFLANNFEKPFWVAPAMNTNMLRHPATQQALQKLESWGCVIYSGESGRLACGDVGEGRLVEPSAMFDEIQAWAKTRGQQPNTDKPGTVAASPSPAPLPSREHAGIVPGKRLLITGGAMTERIDDVRSLVNTSSGRSAAAICSHFLSLGWSVTWLHHESATTHLAIENLEIPDHASEEGAEAMLNDALSRLTLYSYRSYEDLQNLLEEELRQPWDLVVHAAAVSDWTLDPAKAPSGKLETGERLILEFVPRPKMLTHIRGLARSAAGKPSALVAFKLTVSEDEQSAMGRINRLGDSDAVVWNDLTGLDQMSAGQRVHHFKLFDRQLGAMSASGSTDTDLARAIAAWYATRKQP